MFVCYIQLTWLSWSKTCPNYYEHWYIYIYIHGYTMHPNWSKWLLPRELQHHLMSRERWAGELRQADLAVRHPPVFLERGRSWPWMDALHFRAEVSEIPEHLLSLKPAEAPNLLPRIPSRTVYQWPSAFKVPESSWMAVWSAQQSSPTISKQLGTSNWEETPPNPTHSNSQKGLNLLPWPGPTRSWMRAGWVGWVTKMDLCHRLKHLGWCDAFPNTPWRSWEYGIVIITWRLAHVWP